MARLLGVHEIELNPGVNAEDFERFFTQEAMAQTSLPGVAARLYRGDRGERNGQFLLIWEFESVERRDALFPSPDIDTLSAEVTRWNQDNAATFEKWRSMATWPSARYTDYVEQGR